MFGGDDNDDPRQRLPFTLIRTVAGSERQEPLPWDLPDAFIKILRADGVTGLYRGFLSTPSPSYLASAMSPLTSSPEVRS